MGSSSRWVTRGALLLLAAACPLAARAQLDAAAPLADDPTVIALAVALACSDPPEQGASAPEAPSAPAAAPVEVVATVRARALAFEEVPRADAVLPAGAGAKVTWRAERVNLPRHPRAGVVYRDVEVRLTISAPEDVLAGMLGQARRVARGIRIEDGSEPPPTATPTPTSTSTPN